MAMSHLPSPSVLIVAMNATDQRVLELFDNEALWDADDTDEFVLKLFEELEAQGESLVTAKDLGWNTLLHTAALWNRPKIMDELIRKGAELNVANKNGHTPLDLAMHWGHHELALQLQHYGGKHTCEKERDIAISQRDLAQEQIRECEAELMEALHRLKRTKHEREEFRIERDRLLQLHSQLSEERNQLLAQSVHMHQSIDSLTTEKRALQIKTAQLTDELATEQATRQNAVQGWKLAELALADMQQMQESGREREEEALVMRNEALEERDLARELARQAQVDQGLARQTQIEAERERDKAIATLLDAEKEIAAEKALWRKKIAKTELDRRNIQIEIDYQTELLRAENARLEKRLAEMTVEEARAREELVAKSQTMKRLQQENALLQNDLAAQGCMLKRLEDQVAALLDERKEEYRTWRSQIEEKLQHAIAMQLKQMLEASAQTWHALTRFQSRILSLDTSTSTKKSSSPVSKAVSNAFNVLPKRPNTTTSAASANGSNEKASRLPFLPEKASSMKPSASLPAFGNEFTPETALSCPGSSLPHRLLLLASLVSHSLVLKHRRSRHSDREELSARSVLDRSNRAVAAAWL